MPPPPNILSFVEKEINPCLLVIAPGKPWDRLLKMKMHAHQLSKFLEFDSTTSKSKLRSELMHDPGGPGV